MKYPICVVLVILVFATSPNRAQHHRSNARRAAGMVPFPRIGRRLAMSGFARADGSAGLVNYPRVGRSGSLAFEPNGDRDFDVEHSDDSDYNRYYPNDWEESGKRFEESKNDAWAGNQQSTGTKKERRHPHHCNQHADGPWALLFASRDASNLNQQPIRNFVPRLAREMERETATTSDVM